MVSNGAIIHYMVTRITLRLPDKLHLFYRRLANRERRPLNTQFLIALEKFANEAGFEAENDLQGRGNKIEKREGGM